jgi:hypothetical protein
MRAGALVAALALPACHGMFGLDNIRVTDGATPDAEPDGALPDDAATHRVRAGLLAYWTFDEGVGTVVNETASSLDPNNTPAVDLTINDGNVNPMRFVWVPGGLSLLDNARTRNTVVTRLSTAPQVTGGVSFEVWVTTADLTQSSGGDLQPVRIATIGSPNNSQDRNIAIGQARLAWTLHLRTSDTGLTSGEPILATPNLATTAKTHIVVTNDTLSRSIYLDGVLVASDQLGGSQVQWDPTYLVAFGSDVNGNNKWLGTFHAAAVYDRALSAADVAHNFALGSEAPP